MTLTTMTVFFLLCTLHVGVIVLWYWIGYYRGYQSCTQVTEKIVEKEYQRKCDILKNELVTELFTNGKIAAHQICCPKCQNEPYEPPKNT